MSRGIPAWTTVLIAFITQGMAVMAQDEATTDNKDFWTPSPPVKTLPNPRLKPRTPPPRDAVKSILTWDGTFESFEPGTLASQLKGEDGKPAFFGSVDFVVGDEGYESNRGLSMVSGWVSACGVEGWTPTLKPNTWYRVGMMAKGFFYSAELCYPGKEPASEQDEEYVNHVVIDNNYGNGVHAFYYVCSECNFVKEGKSDTEVDGKTVEGDGHWLKGGFRTLPDNCPQCGAPQSALYRESNNRHYPEWTYIYADFRTNDYVGKNAKGLYHWWTVFVCLDKSTRIDDFDVFEIDGEGGEPIPPEKR